MAKYNFRLFFLISNFYFKNKNYFSNTHNFEVQTPLNLLKENSFLVNSSKSKLVVNFK